MTRIVRRFAVVAMTMAAAGGGVRWVNRRQATDPAAAVGVSAEAFRTASEADRRRLARAAELMAAGRHESAVQVLNGLDAKDGGPVHLRAVVLTGQCMLGMGNLAEAERVFAYAAETRPDDPDAHRGLAIVYDEMGASGLVEFHLNRVAELDPTDHRAAALLGSRLLDMKEYTAAETALRTALGRTPPAAAAADLRRNLAVALNGQTRYAEAVEALGPAGHPADRVVRAESLRLLGRLDEAGAECEAGLATADDPRLRLEAGLLAAARGDDPTAIAAFERVVAAAPSDKTAWYQLGVAYQRLGRTADAARAVDRFKDIDERRRRVADLNRRAISRPWDAAVRRELAEACRRIDRPDLGRMWDRAAAACPPPKRPEE